MSLPERLLQVGNPLRHIGRFFLQPRLRLAWGLILTRSSWWMMFIIYTPIYARESGLGELMGAAIVSIGSAWTLTLPFWGWFARRYSLRRLMYMGFTVAAGMSLLFLQYPARQQWLLFYLHSQHWVRRCSMGRVTCFFSVQFTHLSVLK